MTRPPGRRIGLTHVPVRLRALPYATECIACARRDERRDSIAGRSSPINRIAAFKGEDESEQATDEAYEEIR